jgi:TonB-dependent starch-binding outer membrane protein SusC
MGASPQLATRLFVLAFVWLLHYPAAASAQQERAIHGVVADESTWRPVSAARVTLVETGVETRTGDNGTFVFPNPPLGRVSIRVEAPGFPTMVEEVEVTADASLFVQFILPNVHAVLDEIFVLARSNRPQSGSAEAVTAADLLAMEVRGVLGNSGMVGADGSAMMLRGVGSISLQGDPLIFLDGVRMSGGAGEALLALARIPASEIRDIRVLRGPAASFLRGSADGVIEVRTKSGADKR